MGPLGQPIHRPSRNSLPIELDQLIFLHLNPDSSAAAALSRVSKRFRSAAEVYLWRNISILAPGPADGSDKPNRPASCGMRERLKGMMDAADREKWGMVRGMTVTPTAGALHALIQILDNISPNLESLTLHAPSPYPQPLFTECLDFRLLTCGIEMTFINLTEVRIAEGTFRYAEFIIILCDLAQNVAVLDVAIYEGYHLPPQSQDDGYIAYPQSFTRKTSIRRLHIAYTLKGSYTVRGTDPMDTVLGLLDHSPELLQLSLTSNDKPSIYSYDLTNAIARLANLTDLYWPLEDLDVDRHSVARGAVVLPQLRHLVLAIADEKFPTYTPHPLPNLEAVIFDYTPSQSHSFATFLHHDWVQMQMPEFCSWLEEHPRLHSLRVYNHDGEPYPHHPLHAILDELGGTYTGTIRSLIHRGSELIQVSLPFQQITFESKGNPEPLLINKRVLCLGGSGWSLCENVKEVGVPEWETFAALDEQEVPAEIVEEMRALDGLREEDWAGRGVKVSAEAWKVVTDWRRRQDGETEDVESEGGVDDHMEVLHIDCR